MSIALKSWVIRQALAHSKRTILLALVTTLIIGSGVRFIFVDENVMNMLPKDIDSRRVWDEIVDEFKYSDFLFVAFGRDGQNVLNTENLALVWDLSEAFEMIPQVDEVLSLSTLNRMDNDDGFLVLDDLMPQRNLTKLEIESLADYLKDNSNLSSQMLGKNGDYINIIIRPTMKSDFPAMVSSMREITAPFEEIYDFHFGGQPYIAGKVPGLILKETQKLMLLGLIIMSVILLANLRSLPAVGMILSLIIMSMLSMIGFLGWIYYFTGSDRFVFIFINSSMPLVLLTIANSDGVHIMSRFF